MVVDSLLVVVSPLVIVGVALVGPADVVGRVMVGGEDTVVG